MAPYGGLANSLPVLNKIFQWFMVDHLRIEGGLFRLHQKGTSLLVLIGFIFICIENFLDTKAILCLNNNNAYAKHFCWIHGYSYVAKHLQGEATGCFVETDATSAKDAPVTNYYLWLPYMMSLIFVITKLPHILWKSVFENNLIRHLLGGEESWQELFIGGGGGGDGNGNDNGGKKGGDNGNNNNQQGQGEGKKGKKKGNQGKRFKVWKSSEIGKHFVESHKKFTKYHLKYAFWESLNIVSILACMQITDWILNRQFWSYGLNVIHYLNVYQDRTVPLHDPMCQVFPTEVGCRYASGGDGGHGNYQNLLCILGNNIFNQKYFFALWIWWMVLLAISALGVLFRLLRISSPFFSKLLLLRKVHGSQLSGLILTSGECFVLELLIDNLTKVPDFTDSMLREVAANMKEISHRRRDSANYYDLLFHDVNDATAPLLEHGAKEMDIPHWGEKHIIKEKVSPVSPETEHKGDNLNEAVKKDNELPPLVNIDCAQSQDTLVEVNEVSKQTSKKKKNKKNAKVNEPQDEKKTLIPNIVAVECSPVRSGKADVEERRSDQDQTVVSFSEPPAGDWL